MLLLSCCRVLAGLSMAITLAASLPACSPRDFYCHSVGHYLGLDVHDTNTIGPCRTLEPGVVLAIEPGLYIPNHPQFGPYAGIGVRIEDDVLITQTGCEVGFVSLVSVKSQPCRRLSAGLQR